MKKTKWVCSNALSRSRTCMVPPTEIIEFHWKDADIERKIKFHDIPVVSCPGWGIDEQAYWVHV